MRAAINLVVSIALFLASCAKTNPDFEYSIYDPSGKDVAIIAGFQPRGTIEGVLTLRFGNTDASQSEVATFHRITNGVFGWISDGKFVVIGDQLVYTQIASDYFPDGTIRSRKKLVVCIREEMSCASLESKIIETGAIKNIYSFPSS